MLELPGRDLKAVIVKVNEQLTHLKQVKKVQSLSEERKYKGSFRAEKSNYRKSNGGERILKLEHKAIEITPEQKGNTLNKQEKTSGTYDRKSKI